jgi:uncharacterized protein DUF6498
MSPSTKPSSAAPRWPIPPRTLLRPPVVVELVLGLSPLLGVLWWRWDMYLMVMLHLLALAVSGAWLVVRTLVLSSRALCYFNPAPRSEQQGPFPAARLMLTGFTAFVLAVPLVLLAGMVTETLGGFWRAAVHGIGDFWRVVVIDAGLWLPLAFVCAWEAASFAADVVLPALPLARRFSVPTRPIAAAYRALSPELQAFLYARAFVVLRMIVTVLALGVGIFVGPLLGIVGLGVLLVVLKTAVAVFLEAGAVVDADAAARR